MSVGQLTLPAGDVRALGLERAKYLASLWISHGQGITAVSDEQWEEMAARMNEAEGIVPLSRWVMREEAHREANLMNDMVVADRYDTNIMDRSERRYFNTLSNMDRFFPYFSDVAQKSYMERKRFVEGVMENLDEKIVGGTGGIRISNIPQIIDETLAGMNPIKRLSELTGIPESILYVFLALTGFLFIRSFLRV